MSRPARSMVQIFAETGPKRDSPRTDAGPERQFRREEVECQAAYLISGRQAKPRNVS